jgi:hypothetical protein
MNYHALLTPLGMFLNSFNSCRFLDGPSLVTWREFTMLRCAYRPIPTNIQRNTMNDRSENQLAPKHISQDPSLIVIPRGLSHRMIAEANEMFREAFSTPRARKRKASHQQERRARAKQSKKLSSP